MSLDIDMTARAARVAHLAQPPFAPASAAGPPADLRLAHHGLDRATPLLAPPLPAAIGGSGRWTKEEDEMLRAAVAAIGPRNWKRISQEVLKEARSDVQCLQRWKVLRPGRVKGPWTSAEDDTIVHSIQAGATKWSEIAAQIPGRVGKQCRERWFNHLDPTLKKGAWSEEEDDVLIAEQNKLGNRWCEIAKLMPGRSENAVKNRWNSAGIRRKKQAKRNASVFRGANASGKAGGGKRRRREAGKGKRLLALAEVRPNLRHMAALGRLFKRSPLVPQDVAAARRAAAAAVAVERQAQQAVEGETGPGQRRGSLPELGDT
jgi:hypothetical protein